MTAAAVLTDAQERALVVLATSSTPLTATDLGRRTGSRGGAHTIIRHLRAAGLVEPVPGRTLYEALTFHVTDAGDALVPRLIHKWDVLDQRRRVNH